MPLAFASASGNGKSESASPWISSVGALILSMTDWGLDRRSRSMAAGSARPVVAIDRYAWQTSSANRPHCAVVAGLPDPRRAPGPGGDPDPAPGGRLGRGDALGSPAPSAPEEPLPDAPPLSAPDAPPPDRPAAAPSRPPPAEPKHWPADGFWKTPFSGPPPVPSGRNERARSFQVIIGTIAS